MLHRFFSAVLILLNLLVLLGQLWPAGAPPFARWVNIVTLILNLMVLVVYLRSKRISS